MARRVSFRTSLDELDWVRSHPHLGRVGGGLTFRQLSAAGGTPVG
jgi:hypothetical protein